MRQTMTARLPKPLRGALGAAALAAMALGASGCAIMRAPVVPPQGALFTQFKAPLQTHFANEGEGTRTGPSLRVGESETKYVFVPFFWVTFAWGDASVDNALSRSGISTLHYADYEYTNILGIYAETKVIVYGE